MKLRWIGHAANPLSCRGARHAFSPGWTVVANEQEITVRFRNVMLTGVLALGSLGAVCDPGRLFGGGEVRIRLHNASAVDFASARVGFPDGYEEYGAVGAGRRSEYRSVERAYRYAYVEVHAEDRRWVLQPIDYVGEELLESGDYAYRLVLDPGSGGLSLSLVEE